jgi:LmbE family N-acetylglucosaminyl deacetylase
MKKNIFISPHLDDVVLSCGEYLKKLSKTNENITVLTVFAGSQDPSLFSDIAKKYHKKCGLDDDAVYSRREEDKNAMRYFNCKYIHLDILEILYRMDKFNKHKCKSEKDIFNRDIKGESDTIKKIIEEFENNITINEYDNVYLPLSLGNHIDHVLTTYVMTKYLEENFKNLNIFYYEDVPYTYNLLKSEWKVEYLHESKAYIMDISLDEWEAKLEGIEFYKSQVRALWESKEEKIIQLNSLSKYLKFGKRKLRFWQKTKVKLKSESFSVV